MKNTKYNYVTFPNQKIICINKPNYTGDYLSVGNPEWIEASKQLTYSAFKLYLYLAGNKNKYEMALSKQAVINVMDISKNSYFNAVKELEDNRYLMLRQGNIYDFYTTPKRKMAQEVQSNSTISTNVVVHNIPSECNNVYQPEGTEINKITNKNNLNIDADAKKKERKVEDLSFEEKEEIYKHFTNRDMKYTEIYKYYNLVFGCLNDNIIKSFDDEVRIEKIRRRDEEKKQANQNALVSFGLSASEGDELCSYLIEKAKWEEFGDTITNFISSFTDDLEMSAFELLKYLRENEYARCDTYNRNRWNDSRFIINQEYRWDYYGEYLSAYIANPDVIKEKVIEYELNGRTKDTTIEKLSVVKTKDQVDTTKWIVKNDCQRNIFGSWDYTDSELMEIIKEIYIQNGNSITIEDCICDNRLSDADSKKVLAYVNEILVPELKRGV